MPDRVSPVEQTCRLTMSDGLPLFCRRWQPVMLPPGSPPRGRILALHGIQSHSGWYSWSSRFLAERGYEVWFPDRRGAGHSRNPDSGNLSLERLTADVVELLDRLRQLSREAALETAAPPAPVYLLGLSWGGRLATAVAAATPGLIDGLILLYPAVAAHVGPSPVQAAVLRWLCRRGLGGLRFGIPLNDPALFTDDPETQEMIRTDELALRKAPAAVLHAGVQLVERVQNPRLSLTMPVLLLLAGADRIVDSAATRAIVERAAGDHCTTRVYSAAAHTLEFDREREQIFADLAGWLDERSV